MSTLSTNQNHLSPTGFYLRIANPGFSNTNFTIVEAALPGINLSEVAIGFRGEQGYEPGDKLQFDPVTMKMIIQEDMENYQEVFNWLLQNQSAENALKSDLVLTILTSHKNPNWEVTYKNAFPTSISGVTFSTQTQDVEYLTADVTFRYNGVSFRRISG